MCQGATHLPRQTLSCLQPHRPADEGPPSAGLTLGPGTHMWWLWSEEEAPLGGTPRLGGPAGASKPPPPPCAGLSQPCKALRGIHFAHRQRPRACNVPQVTCPGNNQDAAQTWGPEPCQRPLKKHAASAVASPSRKDFTCAQLTSLVRQTLRDSAVLRPLFHGTTSPGGG